MSLSRRDIFNLDLCIRGLGNQLTYMFDDIEEFMCQLTFRSRWPNNVDADELEIKDGQYNHAVFFNSKDPYVKICAKLCKLLLKHKIELCGIWHLDEEKDLNDSRIIEESSRYPILITRVGKPKNMYKMGIAYAKILHSFIDCLHSYRCAITLQSYKIPKERDVQFAKSYRVPLKENKEVVESINRLIADAMQYVRNYDTVAKRDASFLSFL